MSHYKSITVTRQDTRKHYNIRSVVNGKKLSPKKAEEHAEKTKSYGKAYDSIPQAVKAAKALSKTQKMPKKKKATKKVK